MGLRGQLASGVGWGLVIGAWFGVLDGTRALPTPGTAIDRLATMGVALATDAAIIALLGALIALLVWPFTRRRADGAAEKHSQSAARRVLLIGAVLVSLGLSIHGSKPARSAGALAERGEDRRLNVLLISVDTLRPDHLSAYAYGRDTSPNLRALADDGVLFETAYSHSTWTLPAHVSMFTGLDPIAHGVLEPGDRVNPRLETLAERLRTAGYQTEAWVGTPPHGFVGARFGFADGYDHYRHFPHPQRGRRALVPLVLDALWLEHVNRGVGNARAQIDSVLHWLPLREPRPFFVFVHLYDVHSKAARLPYEAPPPFFDQFCPGTLAGFNGCAEDLCASERLMAMSDGRVAAFDAEELEAVRCLYDGGVAYADHEIGRLIDALEREGLAEDTLVVVTSDHGEAFLEHDKPLHTTLHDEVTRIPLIVRMPGGVAGKRVRGIVRLVDLLPTILEVAGQDADSGVQGSSFVDVLRSWPVEVTHEVIGIDHQQVGTALRRGSLKLIHYRGTRAGATDELYDLAADVGETWNRIGIDPESAREMAATLERRWAESEALRASLSGTARVEPVELSEAERAQLRALGYAPDDDPDARD